MITALEFYDELRNTLFYLDTNHKIENEPIMLLETQIEMLRDFFCLQTKNFSDEQKKNLIVDVLEKPNSENGKVYEALLYAWLEKQKICFTPQFHIEQESCFKTSKQGYDADGVFEENNVVFDVKRFGLTLPHIEVLRRKLQDMMPEDYFLTISEGKNINAKDFQSDFLGKLDELKSKIMESKKIYTDYFYQEPKYGLEFRLWYKKESSIFTAISEFDPYEWAENNQFYFIYHASQFCINSSYILFCPYDRHLVPFFSDKGTAITALRTFCRRIFMNLTKMDKRFINEFDGKARNGISVATAAKKISAIVFIDLSEDYNYENCRTFVFQNPNADCKIPRYQINSLFSYKGAMIETFEHDNY